MAIHIVRLGERRRKREGLLLGIVRLPAMFQRKAYDAWLPELAPSKELLRDIHNEVISWRVFVGRYRAEMKTADRRHLIALLAALSHRTNLSVGCYCPDEEQCHRSILRDLLDKAGAELA